MPRPAISDARKGERLLEAMEQFRCHTTRHGVARYNTTRRELVAFIAELDRRARVATASLRSVCDIAGEEQDDAHDRIVAAIQRARATLLTLPPA